ncbi:hypothetical protein EMCRGX_G016166 [Ephydatia muelleri]|eukprot:Em0008g1042a
MNTMRESVRDGTGCMVLEGLLGFLNAILSVTVFAAPYWRQTSYNDPNGVLVFHYSGLWQNCSAATCTIIPMAAPAFLVGARVFMSAAVLLSLLAVTLSLSRMWHRAKLLFSVGTCYTAQVIFLVLGLAVFMTGREKSHIGWTYLVGCTTVVIAALCVMCSFGLVCCQLHPITSSQPASSPQKISSSYTPLSQFEVSGSTSSEGEN